MSGALAERVFAHKITRIGFERIAVHDRRRFGVDDVCRYPLFTPDLVRTMRDTLPRAQQPQVATAVTISARRP